MIRILLFLVLAIPWTLPCFAQKVVNTTGRTITNGAITVEYSIGEIAITTLQNPQNVVTQGLLQPRYVLTTAVNEAFDDQFSFTSYPNPVTEQLEIQTDYSDFKTFQIFNATGQVMYESSFNYQPISLTNLQTGIYFIHFKSNVFSKIIKIVKQ